MLNVNFEYLDVVFGNEKLLYFGTADFVVLVYDPVTGTVVDTPMFMFANGYDVYRSE